MGISVLNTSSAEKFDVYLQVYKEWVK